MELYILDSLLRRIEVIDTFESLIWSERMYEVGDFELQIISNLDNRTRFVSGVNLACNLSNRIMTVETVQDITEDDGRHFLKITGPSFENVLRQRMLAFDTAGTWSAWGGFSDTPVDIVSSMFYDVCVLGNLSSGDIIDPLIFEATDWYPTDTIAEPTETYFVEAKYQSLYDGMNAICQIYAIGFRFIRHPTTNLLYFDTYMGSDRTSSQTSLAAVVFSPDLDNLRNTNRLTSSALYKNTAYVVNATSHELVYLDDVDPTIAGFERRVIFVVADDADDSAAMIQKGTDALTSNRMFSALDGQLATVSSYRYETDYYLGDLVELRDDDGTTTTMQVTEQIMIHDKEGERSYPTLSVNTFIFPGSWTGWDFVAEWDDFVSEHWDELP